MAMKLIAVSRVKNEIDIIEAFIRHHIVIFDTIIIMDDGSDDGTYEVLEALKKEGNSIILSRNASIGFDQSFYVSQLATQAINELNADWVFPLDADEFIEPPLGSSLHDVLSAWGPRIMNIGWSNFVWLNEEINHSELNPVLRLVHRLPPRTDHSKVAIPACKIKQKKFLITVGSHQLMIEEQLQETVICAEISLCHFPIREINQFAAKMAISYLQFRSWPGYSPGIGMQYDNPFLALKSGLVNFEASMEAASLRYSVVDGQIISKEYTVAPFRYEGGPLSLTQTAKPFLSNILHHAEAMASKIRTHSTDISILQSKLDDITEQLAVMKKLLADECSNRVFVEQEFHKSLGQVNELAIAYTQSEAAIRNIRRSVSWRITQPIRLSERLIRRIASALTAYRQSQGNM